MHGKQAKKGLYLISLKLNCEHPITRNGQRWLNKLKPSNSDIAAILVSI